MEFDKSLGMGETLSLVRELSEACAALGGTRARYLNNLVQSGAYVRVVEYENDPTMVPLEEREDYLYAAQIQALLSKQDFLDLGYDRRSSAILKFIAAERKCRETNERLWTQLPERDVAGVLHTAQRKIADILGPPPSLDDLDRKSVV